MKDQLEALRLAEFLEMHWCNVDMPEAKAAAELRRLHQFAEDQIGRATAAEAALQMTKATHSLKIAAVEAQRDALLEALEQDNPAGRAATITALRAALAAPIPHGCHVDLEEGMEPDGCVLDEGRPDKCIYARRLHREGKDKTACEYWKPIEVRK